MQAPMHPVIANRYQLLAPLGQGGMGAVYCTLDRLTRRHVALKRVLVPETQREFSASTAATDPRLALALEFRTLAGMRHPHIISVLDYGFDAAGHPFFTMELLTAARTITDAAKDAPLPTRVRLLYEMLLALDYLHRRGVFHRDLKPANVLVTAAGQVRVLDFGLAQSITEPMAAESDQIAGTLSYIAPELLTGTPASVASDLYAVGVIAYEIFVGRHPYGGKNMMGLLSGVLHKAPDTTSLDPALAAVLDRLLAKAPDARWDSAYDVIHALSFATDQPLPAESAAIRESVLQASAFVGRDDELRHLRDVLQAVLDGGTAFWLVGGESGVGKSRLVDELRIRAQVSGAIVLRGQGTADGGLPYQVWRDPVRRLVLSAPLTSLEASILKALVPDIGTLLDREVADAPELAGSAQQQRLILTLVELFKRQPLPTLLILEDLQWASESLAVLRQMLLVRDQLAPVLVLGTYRDDERPELPDELPGMEVLRLARLDAGAIARLSESMLGTPGTRPEIIGMLQRETEGNAFFMVEVVRALAEHAGSLAAVGSVTLPAQVFAGGVQQVVARRLGRLREDIRTWLMPVAVAGRQLDLAIIDRLHPQAAAQREQFLLLCANAAALEVVEGVWRFSHDKIREALLAELAPDERARLSRQVAEAIEAVYPGDTRFNEALLEHWHDAGDVDKSTHYLAQVADVLVRVSAEYDRADALLKRGLALLPAEDSRRVALLNALARSHGCRGHVDETHRLASEALALAQTLQNERAIAASLFELAWITSVQQQYAQSEAYARQCLAFFQTAEDENGVAACLTELGWLATWQRVYPEAGDYLRQSLAIYQQRDDTRGIATCLHALGFLASLQEDYAQAESYYLQSMALYQSTGDIRGIALTLDYLGTMEDDFGRKDYARAATYYTQAIDIGRRIGDGWNVANTLTNLGFIYIRLGDSRAQSTLCQALALGRSLGRREVIVEAVAGFGWLLLQRDNAARAAALVGLARQHSMGDPANEDTRMAVLLPLLEAAMPADALEAALKHGEALDLDTVATALLAEFGG